MAVCADPVGVTLKFYDKDKKTLLRTVHGKGKVQSQLRAERRNAPDPDNPDYSLGSTDWLTDIMVAETDEELEKMNPSVFVADPGMTSTCSRMVCVQYEERLPDGRLEMRWENNCVTLAIVDPGTQDANGRLLTKEIHIFPEGTNFDPGDPDTLIWNGTIDYLLELHKPVGGGD